MNDSWRKYSILAFRLNFLLQFLFDSTLGDSVQC